MAAFLRNILTSTPQMAAAAVPSGNFVTYTNVHGVTDRKLQIE